VANDRALGLEHLRLLLRPLNRALRAAAERQGRIADRLIRPDATPFCVTMDQVKNLLDDVDVILCDEISPGMPAALTSEETAAQQELRRRAATAGVVLPMDRLSQVLGLSGFEQESVLLCAAPELDRCYERIYAYIIDDLNRRYPCIDLLSSLTAASLDERLERRHALSRFGRLRRTRLLEAHGEPATELRQELRLAAEIFDFLTGATGDVTSLFYDPAEIAVPDFIHIPPGVETETIRSFGRAIVERRLAVLGIWGARHGGQDDAAMAIAAATGLPLRRWSPTVTPQHQAEEPKRLREAIQTATVLDAVLWIQTDALNEQNDQYLFRTLIDQLAASQIPILLTGVHPVRPTELLVARPYAELELGAPNHSARSSMWELALPEMNGRELRDLAARFRVNNSQVRAAVQTARTQAWISGNGHAAPFGERLEAACAAVMRRHSYHFATVIKPKRGPEDLILPAGLHRQVMEIAQFFRVWPQVADSWGFGRLITGEGGIKVLFTGDSGTGKTLAAEVIAGLLKMPLLKVDLARIVSKWVGETEKHLESAFREAEDSHAVLFFDEADALFGKRGEIQHGTDRYANLEVSYLLQRLEEHNGLVILASNLKDNIDSAFTRRFQVIIHFPRPELAERRRIWEIAFPKTAPIDSGIDLDALSRLDLTGAGIVNSAHTSALMAADEGGATITMSHIVRAIARQYRREARILTASDFGSYAVLLQETR
jgi:ATPase family associated with various cellular activities (AAA)